MWSVVYVKISKSQILMKKKRKKKRKKRKKKKKKRGIKRKKKERNKTLIKDINRKLENFSETKHTDRNLVSIVNTQRKIRYGRKLPQDPKESH